jgi:hypothetical protein
MKRKWKIAAAVVGVLIVILAAIPLFVNVNTFKPLIEEQLTTALGRQTKLGDLSLSLLSGTVVARDLTIADDPKYGTQPFVTAKEFRIGVQMRPLIFNRQILVNSLEIDTPQIHLVHAASGAWNFFDNRPECRQPHRTAKTTVDHARSVRRQLRHQRRTRHGRESARHRSTSGLRSGESDRARLLLLQAISFYSERSSTWGRHVDDDRKGRPNQHAGRRQDHLRRAASLGIISIRSQQVFWIRALGSRYSQTSTRMPCRTAPRSPVMEPCTRNGCNYGLMRSLPPNRSI